MKRMLVWAAALSLALIACEDDSSSGPSEQSSAREVSMSFKGCYENLSKKVSLLKESSEEFSC